MADPTTREALFREILRLTPSKWAEEVRWIRQRESGKLAPYSFQSRPYLAEPHDDQATMVVVNKGSQTGFTELGLNRALHALICLGRDVLTVLPQDEQIRAFVQARVDPAFEASPILAKLAQATSNPKHKRVGQANWYFRGSNTEAALLEIPVSVLVLDELDRLAPQSIPLAMERLTGIAESERRTLKLSTPTYAGRGIDAAYRASSRGRWVVPCPHCKKEAPIDWGKSLDIPEENWQRAHWRCGLCGAAWTEEEKRLAVDCGWWRHAEPLNPVRGYSLSQLYSPTETARSIAMAYVDAKGGDDPQKMRVFFNSKLALPWAAIGEQLTDVQIDAARRGDAEDGPYEQRGESDDKALVTMGVDQGPRCLHVNVAEWDRASIDSVTRRRRDIAFYKVTEWSDLDGIMQQHNVSCCVVDVLPETRNARNFQARWPDQVWLALYPEGLRDLVKWIGFAANEHGATGPLGLSGGYVQINRTEAFDRLFARFEPPLTIRLPEDLGEEARAHLKALSVVEGTDRWGQVVRRYENGRRPDHYAHAMLYSEIAGLQVGEIGPGEAPRERGETVAPATIHDDVGLDQEFDTIGHRITGV